VRDKDGAGIGAIRIGKHVDAGICHSPSRVLASQHDDGTTGQAGGQMSHRRAHRGDHFVVAQLETRLSQLAGDLRRGDVAGIGEYDERAARPSNRGDHLRRAWERNQAVARALHEGPIEIEHEASRVSEHGRAPRAGATRSARRPCAG
jgi:hypothetical protein